MMYTLVQLESGEYLVLAQNEYYKLGKKFCMFNDNDKKVKASIVSHSGRFNFISIIFNSIITFNNFLSL